MHDRQVAGHAGLVRLHRYPVRVRAQDDVVADNRVGSRLDSVVAAIPHHVRFENVGRTVTDGAVREDARIVRVVDYVVADDVVVAAS